MHARSHRLGLALVLGAVLTLFLPLLVSGEVLLSDDLARTSTLTWAQDGAEPRPFRDQSSAFLPALAHQLSEDRAGWLSTFDPHVELGRPAWQTSGLTKAWLPTHVLSWFVRDPYVLYSLLVFLAVACSVVCAYGLLATLELEPAACTVGSLFLGLGFYVVYWLPYVLYLWGVCWTLGLLWGALRFLRRPSAAAALGTAFAAHALVLTASPQQVVWHAYLDLLLAAERSSRPEVGPAFFAELLPALGGVGDVAAFLASVFEASLFGAPVAQGYPMDVRGVSWTPVACALALFGALRRGALPWLLFAVATVLFTVLRPLHAFGVEHLGLGISRHAPMAGAHLSIGVLAALGTQMVLTGERSGRRVAAAVASTLLGLACALGAGLEVVPAELARALLLGLGAAAFAWWRMPALAVLLALATVLVDGAKLRVSRPLAEIASRSELVERLGAETADGTRYLWAGQAHAGSLHPNQEALFGLASVHSNNSLSSRAYQDWLRLALSSRALMEGRLFARLPDEVTPDPARLALAGVAVVLSTNGVPWAGEELARWPALVLQRAPAPPLREALLTRYAEVEPGELALRGRLQSRELRRVVDLDDRLAFELEPLRRESVLLISQQHHPQWAARSGAQALETVRVNGFYQGVLVPPGTARVELSFRPWVRWSWVPQVLFALLFSALGLVSARRAGTSKEQSE